MMTPEAARDIGRGYQALANNLAESGATREANSLERKSYWWLTYSQTLAATKGGHPA